MRSCGFCCLCREMKLGFIEERYNNNFTSLCSTLNFYTISRPNSLIFRQNFFEKSSNGKSWVNEFFWEDARLSSIILHSIAKKYRIRFFSVHTKRFHLTKTISVKRKKKWAIHWFRFKFNLSYIYKVVNLNCSETSLIL